MTKYLKRQSLTSTVASEVSQRDMGERHVVMTLDEPFAKLIMGLAEIETADLASKCSRPLQLLPLLLGSQGGVPRS
jgi:hypothetical protein